MSDAPTTWSIGWMSAWRRERWDAVCPPTLDDLTELGFDALHHEQWGDAVAIFSFVLDHRIHVLAQQKYGSYERELHAEIYGKAAGAWQVALTVWRTLDDKKRKRAEVRARRKASR